MVRAALLVANLPQLQNLIKRDPAAYKEEFLQQWNHYDSSRRLFNLNPDDHAAHFRELITFISQVATCYPKETAEFPSHLFSLLVNNYSSLPQDLKKSILQNLVMLRKKDLISSIDLLKHLFPLLSRTSSANLRLFIQHTILSDIVSANTRHKNHRLNKAVQAMLFSTLERGMETSRERRTDPSRSELTIGDGSEAMWTVILTKELWKKGVWTDAKAVAIITLGCTYPSTKVQSASIHFFIGQDSDGGEIETEHEHVQEIDVRALRHRREINKKTRSGEKKFKNQLKSARNKSRSKMVAAKTNFSALELVHDPQTFAENIFDLLNRHDNQFDLDHKVLIMQLLSRIMSVHKICVFNFYTYIVKFLHHRQLRIPSILVALAQSVHDMTPPDAVEPLIRKLAQEFVHPGVASEVIAAGLNSIREISKRQPWAINADLLEDLIQYRKSKDKSIMAAARGLLQLYREVHPSMLKRKDRGKEASMSEARKPLPFGHISQAAVDIEGLTLLEDYFTTLHGDDSPRQIDDMIADGNWALESDSSSNSDSDEWINVGDEEGDIVISDSDGDALDAGGPGEVKTSTRVSTLATTRILTPSDFALLDNLRTHAVNKTAQPGHGSTAKRKHGSLTQALDPFEGALVTEDDIIGTRKKVKADYAERMASVQGGRDDRGKFGSHKGKEKKDVPSSSTNKEKNKHKPIMMILSSDAVRSKKRASLRDKQRKLRVHIESRRKGNR